MTMNSTKGNAANQGPNGGMGKNDGPGRPAIERCEVTPYQMTPRKTGVESPRESTELFEKTVSERRRATPSASLS
jgi:hypothetical protein